MTKLEEYLIKHLKKTVVNKYPTTDTPYRYRHPDIYNIAMDAHQEGREYFYCKPLDPEKPYGKYIECEPIYVYKCNIELSEEEYENLTREISDQMTKLKD